MKILPIALVSELQKNGKSKKNFVFKPDALATYLSVDEKGESMKKILILIWATVLVYAAYSMTNYFLVVNKNQDIYVALREKYRQEAIDEKNMTDKYKRNTEGGSEKVEIAIMERYRPLLTINEEIIGWITLPETQIDYPVVQTKDNEFYLNHNIYKEPSKTGSIFMDFRNRTLEEERHTILYGHSMKDGSMFMGLLKYKDPYFLSQNPMISFNTLYEEVQWEIFSVYVTSVDFYYIQTDFLSTVEYGTFLDRIRAKSIFDTGVVITAEDQILTLSTCSYEFEDARFVIHAKRI